MKRHDPQWFSLQRRRALIGGFSTSALSLAGLTGRALAQTPPDTSELSPLAAQGAKAAAFLRGLPRIALVIGNSAYRQSPLANPANDAKALSGILVKTGFEVTTRLDASRADLAQAVQAYTQLLQRRKCIGLFYFAGHGVQLAWRNYMVPVDAAMHKVADIPEQSFELGALLEGLQRAANPMNIIIMDACRDNPFGSLQGLDQKGLSQVDAPGNTLLAYATAPGNVASDGDDAKNGLYTEHLLREIGVPAAKIEDVFKRVRLGVRLRSRGQQIPWESTSLEADFYFVPPSAENQAAEAERLREFEEELAIWEKIKEAKEVEPLENYLRKYPSGRFAELAQFRLDRVLAQQGEKRIQIADQVANPFTKGSGRFNTRYKLGDWYEFSFTNRLSGEVRSIRRVVTNITEDEVHFNKGTLVTDLFGNQIKVPDGRQYTRSQFYIPEYSIGKRWISQHKVTMPSGTLYDASVEFRVVAREQVTVKAGVFDCFRVKGYGTSRVTTGRGGRHLEFTMWISPAVQRPIVVEQLHRLFNTKVDESSRSELVAYHQG